MLKKAVEEWTPIIQKPLRELSASEIVGRAINLYVSHIPQFIIPFLVSGTVTSFILWYLNQFIPSNLAPDDFLNWVTSNLTTIIAVLTLIGIVEWTVNAMASGIAVKSTSNLLKDEDASLKESVKHTLSKLPSLTTAALLTGLLTVAGLILFVIPGIILIVIFSFVTPAIIIEGRRSIESLRRSRTLAGSRWSTTFAVQLITFMLSTILTWFGGSIEAPIGPLNALIPIIVTAAIQPINPIAVTILFYSARDKENPPAAQKPPKAISFCLQCGYRLSPEEDYCPNCGKKR